MADFGLFIGFGQPVRGREEKASAVFDEAVQLWTRLQQDGEIESWDAVFLEPHGGDLGGFFLLRGEREAIGRLRTGDDLMRLSVRANQIVEGFGIVGARAGAAVQEQMQLFLEAAGELA